MVINNHDQSLLSILQTNIDWAREVVICVAFFRSSGLREIIKKLEGKKKVEVIAGIGFYQTEPQALMSAYNKGFQIYLQKENSGITFHPKVYLFKKGENYRAVIGSSNMTKGGLMDNAEMSYMFDSKLQEGEINNLLKSLEATRTSEDFEKINHWLALENYKVRHEAYRKIIAPAIKKAKKKAKSIHTFDIDKFIEYVDWERKRITDGFRKKNKRYREAKRILDKIAASSYRSAEAFLDDYQLVIDAFHSSGLNRGKTIFSEAYPDIIRMIKAVKDIDSKHSKAQFSEAREVLQEIPKMGINALTEILITYYPKQFPVLNGRTLSVLRNLGLTNKKSPNAFSVEDYFEYKSLIQEIKIQCKLKDFRETDLAISYYYKENIK